MTDKRIKNEQWTVRELLNKVENEFIHKPKYQRKKKWDIIRKKEKNPNIQDYIIFLYSTHNSVHAITFGEFTNDRQLYFSNIDGNNRINAIMHYMNKPFTIFPDYLNDLFNVLNEVDDVDKTIIQEIKDIFYNSSYNDIISIRSPDRYFETMGKSKLYSHIQYKNVIIDDIIQEIQNNLKINNNNFDSYIKINVNLFEKYTNDELCKTFEDINKFDSKLTEIELLAVRLYREINFKINDPITASHILLAVSEYYNEKSQEEALTCYNYNKDTENINAYDFIVGFQNHINKTYNFIEKTDHNGLSLFFKLYKALYGLENTYTTNNINNFIDYINYSCEVLNEAIQTIFTNKLNLTLTLFNNSCVKKLDSFKKNTLYVILCSIIGFYKQKIDKNIIKNIIEKCILFHFMISDISDKNKRNYFKFHDSIMYEAGGAYIDSISKKYLANPESLSITCTSNVFEELIDHLCWENNNPYERFSDNENTKINKDKRRRIQFWEKTLMFYYYKEHMPINMLENQFNLEHIIPNSSNWDGKLDKDRLGNQMPIISGMNSARGNRHISFYKDNDSDKFCEFMKEIIPNNDVYDNIINHQTRKPKVINIDAYNELCEKNQKTYKDNFIKCLFK
jgi:hypothetical protein